MFQNKNETHVNTGVFRVLSSKISNHILTKRDVIKFFILVKGSPEGADEQLLSQLTRYSITATERKTRGG